MKSTGITKIESDKTLSLRSIEKMTAFSKAALALKSDGTIALDSQGGSWKGGGSLVFKAGRIDLNGGSAPAVETPAQITKTVLDDTTFNASQGWIVQQNALKSIVTRAPTHEPYPYHNRGVNVQVNLSDSSAPPPTAVPVAAGATITRTN
jgi:hypothetical protein